MIKLPSDNTNLIKIQSHDVQMHKDISLDNNGLMTPIAWTLVIHVGIIGFVIATNLLPEPHARPPLETALITSNQLATIQSQVLANRSQAANSNTNDPNTPSQASAASNSSSNFTKTGKNQAINSDSAQTKETRQKVDVTLPDNSANEVPLFKKSPATIAFEKKIAETLKQHDAAMKSFETEAERKANAKIETKNDAEKKSRQNMRERVAELKEIEFNATQEESEPESEAVDTEMEVPYPKNKMKNNKSLNSSFVANGVAELASNTLNSGVEGEEKYSMGSIKTQRNNASMSINKIRRRLVPPIGSGHDVTRLEVTVNPTGRVIRASASGTNPALNRAAEKAAMNASPLSITLGDHNYPTFGLTLKGKGNR